MTYVTLTFSPSELGFAHPLSEELVERATQYIKEQLDQVVISHDDSETRMVDLRRTHAQLASSIWIVKYRHNSILITNQITGGGNQFGYLQKGNGTTDICARHMTRRIRPGWSDKDGHKSELLGGKKPVPGSLGPAYPGMLKFYDKHNGMWQYRHCVRPVSAAIVDDFNRELREAVFRGLEMARYELYDQADRDSERSNEPEDASASDITTIEEMSYMFQSDTKAKNDLEEYRIQKLDEEQITMESQISDRRVQEKARGILMQAGLEQPKKRGAGKVDKSIWGKFRGAVGPVTDTVADRIHRWFGVTK